MKYIVVTDKNLEEAREACTAIDQRVELKAGCRTWSITGGQMSVCPQDGRGAVSWGGDSEWGDWCEASRTLHLDSGEFVNDDGEILSEI